MVRTRGERCRACCWSTYIKSNVCANRVLGGSSCRWLTLALLCCLASSLRAQTPAPTTADAYVQQFESSYHDVRSLRAEFTQTYTMGGRTRIEVGRVAFARGGLMRWDYQRPAEKLFLSDGKEASLYIPEEHQLTRTPMKSSEDLRVPFELLLTRLNLRRVFARVEMADAGAGPRPRRSRAARFSQKGVRGGLHQRPDRTRSAVRYAEAGGELP